MFVKDGGVVIAKFQTVVPVCVETFADHPQLGRFTLRDKGNALHIASGVLEAHTLNDHRKDNCYWQDHED